MKQSTAIQHVRNLMTAVQRARSIEREAGTDLVPGVEKYINDPRYSLMNALPQLVDRLDGGGQLTPMEFFNLMIVTNRFSDVLPILGTLMQCEFPEPNIQWLRGWEPEA